MLEEALDPRTAVQPDLARLLAAAVAATPPTTEDWNRFWNDDQSIWANARTIEHWIERARR
jgi:hypothetical protein